MGELHERDREEQRRHSEQNDQHGDILRSPSAVPFLIIREHDARLGDKVVDRQGGEQDE